MDTTPALPTLADSDTADTLAAVRSFDDGGSTDTPAPVTPPENEPDPTEQPDNPVTVAHPPNGRRGSSIPADAQAPQTPAPDKVYTPEEAQAAGATPVQPQSANRVYTLDEAKALGATPVQQQAPDPNRVYTLEEAKALGAVPATDAGPAGTFAKRIANIVGPFVASLPAMTEGAALGSSVGLEAAPFLGPVGPYAPLIGGALGAMGYGYEMQSGMSALQRYLLKKTGLDQTLGMTPEQMAREEQANPKAAFAGDVAPMIATGKPWGTIPERIISAGAMGGQEAGSELGTPEGFQPGRIAGSAAIGALFPGQNRFADRIGGAAGRFDDRRAANAGQQGPLNGEIVPPGTPTPVDNPQLGGPGREGAPSSDDTGGNPPGQGSPGGTPGEAANDNGGDIRQAPGRPDTQPNTPEMPGAANDNQIATQIPGPTPGARTENTAPPAQGGLTPKSLALIAKSKGEAAVSEPTKIGIGTSQAQPAPPKNSLTVGNDTSAPFADRNEPGNQSGRKYSKNASGTTNDNPATMTVDDGSGFTPDVTAVMKAQRPGFNANDNSQTLGQPGKRSPGMAAEARNEPGNQPGNQYGFDINRPANENGLPKPPEPQPPATKAPEVKPAPAPLEPHQLPERQPSYQDWRRGSSVYNPEVLAKYEAQLRQDIGPKLGPDVPETKSAGAPPAGHEIAQAEGQPEHPTVAERGPLWQKAMDELERRGQHGTKQMFEESQGGEEHAQKLLEGIQEIEAAERAQAAKPRNALGKQTGDATKAKTANFKMQVADSVLDHFKHDSPRMPVTQAEKKAVLDNLHEALKAYADTMQGGVEQYRQSLPEANRNDPIPANILATFSATLPTKGEMSGGQRWLKSANALLRNRDPSLGAVHKFLHEEAFHQNPELRKLAQETEQIEAKKPAAASPREDNEEWRNGPAGSGYRGAEPLMEPSPEDLYAERESQAADWLAAAEQGRQTETEHEAAAQGVPQWKRDEQAREERMAAQRAARENKQQQAGPELRKAYKSVSEAMADMVRNNEGSLNIGAWMSSPQKKVIRDTARQLLQYANPTSMKYWDNHVLSRYSDKLFGGPRANPIRTGFQAIERAAVDAHTFMTGHIPLIKRLMDEPAAFGEGALEASRVGQHPKDVYQSKMGGSSAWAEDRHGANMGWYNTLTTAQKAKYNDLINTVKTTENDLAYDNAITQILSRLGSTDTHLADRIATGNETPHDIATHGADTIDALRKLAPSVRLRGNAAYLPLLRSGRYGVIGKYKIDAPAGAKLLEPNRYGFNTAAERDAFSKAQENEPNDRTHYEDPKGNWADPKTGKRYTKDDAADVDLGLVKRYSTTVNPNHFELHDTEHEAVARQAELHNSGMFATTSYQERNWRAPNPHSILASELGLNPKEALKDNAKYEALGPTEKLAVEEALAQKYLDLLHSTRSHNRKLQRQGTAGFMQDLPRVVTEWAQETSQARAMAKQAPVLDQAMKRALELAKPLTGDPKTANTRGVLKNEFAKRIADLREGKDELSKGWGGAAVRRGLAVSALDRLATPAFIIRNMTQNAGVGAPHLKAEFNASHAEIAKELLKATRDVNVPGMFASAWRDTKARAKDRWANPTAMQNTFSRPSITAEERRMLQEMYNRGAISEEAATQGLAQAVENPEGVKLNIGKGLNPVGDLARRGAEKTLTGLDHLINRANDMLQPLQNAAELYNRTSMALATFRMAIKRGASFEDAVQKAHDALDWVHVRYTGTNQAPFKKNIFARIPMQFHQFGFQMVATMGRAMSDMLGKNRTPMERKRGRNQLGYLLAATWMFAGAAGMPLEQIFSPMLTAAKLLGLTDMEWGDVETGFREHTFDTLGKALSPEMAALGTNVLAGGLPQLLSINLTNSLGLNNTLTSGAPDYAYKGNRREYWGNMLKWVADIYGGSAGGVTKDAVGAVNDLVNGDPVKAALGAPFIRGLSDPVKAAYNYAGNAKQNARGAQYSAPYSGYEAVTKGLGFTPARDIDEYSEYKDISRLTKRQSGERSEAVNAWVKSRDPGDLQKAVAAGANVGELYRAAHKKAVEDQQLPNGPIATKSNQPIVREISKAFGKGPSQ